MTRIKQFLFFLLMLLIPLLVVAPGSGTQGDTVGLEIPNSFPLVQTFSTGIVFQSSGTGAGQLTGAVTLVAPAVSTSYSLSLPGSGGTAGYYLAIGNTPGTLSYAGQSGSTAPLITLTPSSVSFGSIQDASSAHSTVAIKNSGNAQLSFYSAPAVTGTGFTGTTTCGTTLNAGASCSATITFSPTMVMAYSGTLTVVDTAASSPQTLAISGTGVAPTPLTITSVAPTSGPQGTSITVNGTGFTSDAAVSLSGNAATTTFGNSTRLTATTPSLSIGPYDVTVTQTSGSTTDSTAFTVTVPMTFTVSLTWNASSSSGVLGYNVYMSTTSGGPYTRLTTVGATSYNDTESVPGTYYYVVTAFNSVQESSYSNEVSAVIP